MKIVVTQEHIDEGIDEYGLSAEQKLEWQIAASGATCVTTLVTDALVTVLAQLMKAQFVITGNASLCGWPEDDPRHSYTDADWLKAAEAWLRSG